MVKVNWNIDKSNKTTIHIYKDNQKLDLTDKDTQDIIDQLSLIRPDLFNRYLDEINNLNKKLHSKNTELEFIYDKINRS